MEYGYSFISKLSSQMAIRLNDMSTVNKLKVNSDYDHSAWEQNPMQVIIQHNMLTADKQFCGHKIQEFILDREKRLITDKVLIELERLGLNITDCFIDSEMHKNCFKNTKPILSSYTEYVISCIMSGQICTFDHILNSYKSFGKEKKKACVNCGKQRAAKKCSTCHHGGINIRYCDELCQQRHWNAHKTMCFVI
jgi:hypothetical protein